MLLSTTFCHSHLLRTFLQFRGCPLLGSLSLVSSRIPELVFHYSNAIHGNNRLGWGEGADLPLCSLVSSVCQSEEWHKTSWSQNLCNGYSLSRSYSINPGSAVFGFLLVSVTLLVLLLFNAVPDFNRLRSSSKLKSRDIKPK